MRAGEQRRACGSNARLARDTGWSPRATLDDTLAATLDDWMHRERDVR
jgi:GDP-4-dehydro-6-deoxy-D-mannose reductase